MSYSCAYFLLEMGGELLQHILHNSSNLQGLARAAGMKLQLLVCFAAANTQVWCTQASRVLSCRLVGWV
jgi:hypothetical protein